jgi:FkbH-like protein
MRLSVFTSFEPVLLGAVFRHWNERVPLFGSVEVHTPSLLNWGLVSEIATDELRVLVVDRLGLLQSTFDGVPAVLQPEAPGPAPLVVLCPDARGAPDPARLGAARGDRIDASAVASAAGLLRIFDPESHRIAQVPYSDAFYLALGTAIFRKAYARLRPPPKVIAVDCDGTLWGGLCAEDGADGVSVGAEELALHAFLRDQKRAGKVLALVSKNVPSDVLAVFETRSDLGISLADVAARQIGWEPKAQSLRRLSRDLGLGLDSFVFIDDNPAECAMVAGALPEVAVLQRPSQGVRSFLEAAWLLDRRDDREGTLGEERTRFYQDEEKRRAARHPSPSFADYVRSLELRVTLESAGETDQPRVFELTQRTNQFNTGADRPSAKAVRKAIGDGQALVVRVADRFGDYGLCGAAFLSSSGRVQRLNRLLLSCRVLGRGVEEEVVDELARRARDQGFVSLEVALVETARNLPARGFFARIARHADARAVRGGLVFPLEGWRPCPRQLDPVEVDMPEDQPSLELAPDWTEVAELTRDPAALGVRLGVVAEKAEGEAGEDGVLAIVEEVLGRPASRSDNLYALGADSLRLVRIVARLRSRLGVDVPIAALLHRADVADLLALVARGERQPEEDPEFLAQVRSLYDEEDPPA